MRVAVAALVPILYALNSAAAGAQNSRERILRTASDVHSLSSQEASRKLPVQLHARVNYYSDPVDASHANLFVQDDSGGVYVSLPSGTKWAEGPPPAGSSVIVTGITGPGDFASIVVGAHVVQQKGPSRLPRPESVTLLQLESGSEDCRWVQIDAVVRSVFRNGSIVTLDLANQEGTITATTTPDQASAFERLVGTHIRLQGVAAALFNHHRQLRGARLFFPNAAQIETVEPGPADPWAVGLTHIKDVAGFDPARRMPHITHVRGTVTLSWPGSLLCVQDADEGICARTEQDSPIALGTTVDVAGFLSVGGSKPLLEDAIFRPSETTHNVAAVPITADQALSGEFDSQLTVLKGTIIGRDLTQEQPTLMLKSGRDVFPIIMQPGPLQRGFARLREGSFVRVTGLCLVQIDEQQTQHGQGFAVAKSFRILLRSADDIDVLKTPSVWTTRRVLLVLLVVLLLTVAVLGWVQILRKKVEKQTRVIRESEERFRHMAQHDALTGLPTRRFLGDRISSVLERGSPLGVALLMLDLDNFKHVNDSLGHQAGDQVLCNVARRVQHVIRDCDTIARLGGDEFVVLLDKLDHEHDAELVAQRIIAAVSEPMVICEEMLTVSVSMGLFHVSDPRIELDLLFKKVDAAMYAAKSAGRNCVRVFSEGLQNTSSKSRTDYQIIEHWLQLLLVCFLQ